MTDTLPLWVEYASHGLVIATARPEAVCSAPSRDGTVSGSRIRNMPQALMFMAAIWSASP